MESDSFKIGVRWRGKADLQPLALPRGRLCVFHGKLASALARALYRESARRYFQLSAGGSFPRAASRPGDCASQHFEIEAPNGVPVVYFSDGSGALAPSGRQSRYGAGSDTLAQLFDLPLLLSELCLNKGAPWCSVCGVAACMRTLEEQLSGYEVAPGLMPALAIPLEGEELKAKLSRQSCMELYGARYLWSEGRLFNAEDDEAQLAGESGVLVATAEVSPASQGSLVLLERANELFKAGVETLLLLQVDRTGLKAKCLGRLSVLPHCPSCGRIFEQVSRETLEKDFWPKACQAWDLGGVKIGEFGAMSVRTLSDLAKSWRVNFGDTPQTVRLSEVCSALTALNFGDYALSHPISTLSPGERFRVHLALLLLSGLSESVLVLDQGASGLGLVEFDECLAALGGLRSAENTVLVVTQERGTVAGAQWECEVAKDGDGLLLECAVATPGQKRKPATWVRPTRREEQAGCMKLCLDTPRVVTVSLPLCGLLVIGGRSGSGKTRLLEELGRASEVLKYFRRVERLLEVSVSKRDCLASLSGIYGEIAELLASTREARMAGHHAASFCLRRSTWRCAVCQGDGLVRFVGGSRGGWDFEGAPYGEIYQECPSCGGERFEPQLLKVRYRELNIADILALTVNQAQKFFWDQARISWPLTLLADFGFGETKLGKSRLQMLHFETAALRMVPGLARQLRAGKAEKKGAPAIFLWDGPLLGLEAAQVLSAVRRIGELTKRGHTVVAADNHPIFLEHCDEFMNLD
ncbi:MAG: hypothetical protein GX589_06725 [Deltaproteobacteria bacterium]|nr:hypothetical protein [Deltaproteobacteria bacterium]